MSLKNDVIEVLDNERYIYNDYAVSRIINAYEPNKHEVVDILRNHRNWNEDNMSICIPATSYTRKFNTGAIHDFVNYLVNEIVASDAFKYAVTIWCAVTGRYYRRYSDIYQRITMRWNDGIEYMWRKEYVSHSSLIANVWPKVIHTLRFIDGLESTFFNSDMDDTLREINSDFPAFHLRNNMKTSKAIGKICREMGWDKFPKYNEQYAALCDEINPLTVHTPTYISVHPCDFLYMSNGHSWTSCHDIRNADDPGCYSSGTISYMLDHYSFIVYTLPKVVTEKPWNQPKLQREVFALKDGVILQSRLYPQSCDNGSEDAYREIRNVVQKVVADCLGQPNLWQTKHYPNVEQYIIHGDGATCYPDWKDGNPGSTYCSLTFLKGIDLTDFTMEIGATPICPQCGMPHDHEDSIICENCDNIITCADCGCEIDRDNAYEIDGEYYCENCVFWCEYHEDYELISNGVTEVYGYGQVCDRALEYGDFYKCEHCGKWKYVEDIILTEDGCYYGCEECAIRDGYRETTDGWYLERKTVKCPHCGRYNLEEDDQCYWCGKFVAGVAS